MAKTTYEQTVKAASFGKWKVELNGDMIYNGGDYEIEHSHLNEKDWFLHMFEKTWIDFGEFTPAFFQACKNAGIQEVSIFTYYE